MKWGLLGGTFDPIHLGHLRCAEEVREMFRLDKVIFAPAASPPLKRSKITPFPDRLKMVKLAVQGNPAFEATDVEGRREGRSYSIDTVRYFRDTLGGTPELFFILGQDAFKDIKRWKDWEELLSLCHFVVVTRPGHEQRNADNILPPGISHLFQYMPNRKAFRSKRGTFVFFRPVTLLDISSTEIRKRISRQKSVRYLLPGPVLDYISRQSLYTPR